MGSRATIRGWGGVSSAAREMLDENLARAARDAVLTRGLGRSYGDSSLPPSDGDTVAGSILADRILSFDRQTGVLRAEAGLSLEAIQRHFLPRGWTFPVLTGTCFVTLGGMVAADVHGKNHHVDGTIGRHVVSLRLLLADGRLVDCSPHDEPDLFRATLGGMGLTGHVIEVTVRLRAIPSPWIWQESERVTGLADFIDGLRQAADNWPFTVGWLDALATGRSLGRGILMRGRWARLEEAPNDPPTPTRRFSVPIHFPSWVLNRATMRMFNELYYRRHSRRMKRGVVHPWSFFHPLDSLRHWNRIYGRRGFTQHQCVLPEKERPGATRRYLELLTRSGLGSFLCVIKDCGEEGEGFLSFPRPGLSIAVDLPMRRDTQKIVDLLNEKVIAEGGRLYLAKDSLSRGEDLRAMDPRLGEFDRVRRRWDPQTRLASAQWRRVMADSTR